jgi:integrase
MPRRRNDERRVLGPYWKPRQRQYQIVIVEPEGRGDAGGNHGGKSEKEDEEDENIRKYRYFDSREEALYVKGQIEQSWARLDQILLKDALAAFKQYRLSEGDRRGSIDEVCRRVEQFFGKFDVVVAEDGKEQRLHLAERLNFYLALIKPEECEQRYLALRWAISQLTKKRYAVDTHRGILKDTKWFFSWCCQEKKWIKSNPLAGIKGRGRVRKGKAQLRQDDVVRFFDKAIELAQLKLPRPTREELEVLLNNYTWSAVARHLGISDSGVRKLAKKYDLLEKVQVSQRFRGKEVPNEGKWAKGRMQGVTPDGALAALMTYTMGLRQGEISKRLVGDVDCNGTVLSLHDGKTEASDVPVKIPEELQPLVRRLIEGRAQNEPLFLSPRTGRFYGDDWVLKQVKRICKLAGIERPITAHGMRGTHASIAHLEGASIDAVMKGLRHADRSMTTSGHYTQPAALKEVQQSVAMSVVRKAKERPIEVTSEPTNAEALPRQSSASSMWN